MKSVFLGFGIAVCGLVSLIIVMTLCGTSMRQNELNRAIDNALEATMENQFNDKTDSADSNEEFAQDFIDALLIQINSNCSIVVNVLDIDYEKGLLSVEVIEKYIHPIGTDGEVSVKRTIIMEQYQVAGG